MPGTTNAQLGQEHCLECDVGRFTSRAFANDTLCTKCEKGEYQNEKGQPSCKPCGVGRWSNTSGLEAKNKCVECKAGTYSKAKGADSPNTCIECQPGMKGSLAVVGAFDADVACQQCAKGRFRSGSDTQLLLCRACPKGFAQGGNRIVIIFLRYLGKTRNSFEEPRRALRKAAIR